MQEEISLMELFNMLKKHLAKIIGWTLIGGVLSSVLMYIFISPKYESTAQLLVNQQAGATGQQIQYSEVQTNVALINTYRDMIKSESILETVSANTGGQISVGELKEAVEVKQESNSQAFNITARTTSPSLSQSVVQNLVTEFENVLRDIYGDDISSIYILSPASFNPNKVSPKLMLFILLGGLLGFVLSTIYALVVEMSDTTLRDPEYVHSLGLVPLGEIFELTDAERRDALMAPELETRSRKRI